LPKRWRARPLLPYFRAGVAFYPGCIESLRTKDGYANRRAASPVHRGQRRLDRPAPLHRSRRRLAAAGEPVTNTVYPNTYHGFDGPPTQPRLRLEVPNGVHPGQGVTVAPNPEARDDAYARLKA
jgi:dienelactone hydrolase